MSRRLLAAAFITVLVPLFGACGDDAGAGSTAPTNTPVGSQSQATNSSSTPKLSSPASQYALSIEDLGANWITDIPHTFVLDAAAYGSTKAFSTPADGLKSLTDWGYVDGYQTGYIPEGRDTAVLNGAYYIQTETHLFKDAAGAQKAFDYFSKYAASAQGAQPVSIQALGNKSVAYVTTLGKVGNTNVNAVYHQVVTMRGNVVTVVLTKGAEGLMKVDTAWQLASIADAKELGARKTIVPTPTSNFTPAAAATSKP